MNNLRTVGFRGAIGALLPMALLSACYSPNQRAFDAYVRERVSIGMPMSTAIANLQRSNMHCVGEGPIDCSRIRQRLLPSSCVERVVITLTKFGGFVDTVEVRPIVCAGL